MSEIKTPPVVTEDENGDKFYTFGPEHSLADIARWVEAANGLPQVPMEAELWAAGCDLETARFVAKQLDRMGYRLIKPHDLWTEHKHFEGERKYALRQILKWIMGDKSD